IPLGFGNAVVLQTNLIALLAHLPESQMPVGTGFARLFRGIGQVGGVAISSALFQAQLDAELRKRIHTPDAEELILKIRRSSDFIRTLGPAEQRAARDAYAMGLKSVYALAACATLLAYLARLPVCIIFLYVFRWRHSIYFRRYPTRTSTRRTRAKGRRLYPSPATLRLRHLSPQPKLCMVPTTQGQLLD
ncbi:hypothetical protein C8R44DRAFT_625210, partial [Mycena epipterygia]